MFSRDILPPSASDGDKDSRFTNFDRPTALEYQSMRAETVISITITAVSVVQLGLQIFFAWLVEPSLSPSRPATPGPASPINKPASNFANASNNCTSSIPKGALASASVYAKTTVLCGMIASDILLGIIILANMLASGFQATISAIKTDGPSKEFEVAETALFAVMSSAFLLCSLDRVRGVLGMVYSDTTTAWLTTSAKVGTFAPFLVPIVVALKQWSENHQSFDRVAVYTSFLILLLTSVIDIILSFAFIKLLFTIAAGDVSTPSAKLESARFHVIATYGLFASTFYCFVVILASYRIFDESIYVAPATSVTYNVIHATLLGMKFHSYVLKRRSRTHKEKQLQVVLGDELDYIRARYIVSSLEQVDEQCKSAERTLGRYSSRHNTRNKGEHQEFAGDA